MQEIPLGKYKHYKGNNYEVIGIARHSETLEKMVVYRALYQEDLPAGQAGGNNLWVRPLTMFIEQVNVEGKLLDRFSKI